ncbi:cAMP-binding and CBS domain-containing putative signal-transduction protein [Desulfocapsa sulfexigens DSM 10523]|uniref:cAMP-binding and CBS domain-containing putative signal-transduction protein n=1 Tax=Desulfocapsa sulfexigens (strain DSM 10523 / SB164P1) TaxID=1167006 RepID=M1PQ49_DESSD|nr:CBS domain-containing protein [Desulfocapsa sulfexigens]AGF78496.1 cAMP-binding and CBS domain-containing putative signal-transduction protein [Desulfocapsa sulfexigens DSM 10523]
MNSKTSIIRDIIIPLDRYPQLNENQTLQEAMETFRSFRAEQQDCACYKGILVVNDKNQLVGKLSLMDIMHGLVPRLVDATNVDKYEGKGKDSEFPNLSFLYEDKTFSGCGKNKQKSIKSLMKAITFSLPADTHMLKALVMMEHRKDFNVPVTDNGTIIGMLRLEEIFNSMCTSYCDIT